MNLRMPPPEFCRPLGHRLGAGTQRQKFAGPRVVGLNVLCRPLAIGRGIGPVVINSFQRHAAWPFSHVGVEILKTQPAIADGDSARPVETITRQIWVCASPNDAAPNVVDGCARFAVGCSCCRALALQATARSRVSSRKVACAHRKQRATNASAVPINVLTVSGAAPQDGEAVKRTASQVGRAHG